MDIRNFEQWQIWTCWVGEWILLVLGLVLYVDKNHYLAVKGNPWVSRFCFWGFQQFLVCHLPQTPAIYTKPRHLVQAWNLYIVHFFSHSWFRNQHKLISVQALSGTSCWLTSNTHNSSPPKVSYNPPFNSPMIGCMNIARCIYSNNLYYIAQFNINGWNWRHINLHWMRLNIILKLYNNLQSPSSWRC